MDHEKHILNDERMQSASGGFPKGEFPPGVNLCPRCGEPKNLILINEHVVDTFGSPSIDAYVPDMTIRDYECANCGFKFMRYGNFYEFS